MNWGVWKSLADKQSGARQVTSESGLRPMADEVAIRALAWAMSPDAPVRFTVVDADWPRLAAAYRTRGSLRIIDDLLTRGRQPVAASETDFRQSIARLRTRTAPRHARRSHHLGGVGGDGPVGPRRFSTRRRGSSNSAWIR